MTPEDVLRSAAKMQVSWLRNMAQSLRDPKTRNEEAAHISRFMWSFSLQLDDAADMIEKLAPSVRPPSADGGLWFWS